MTRYADTSSDRATSAHSADIEHVTEWGDAAADDPALTELAHANRVAAIGQRIASIVHEVNQPIAAIILNAQTALRWLDAQPPDLAMVRLVLTRIVGDGNRAANVVNRSRALIKKAPPRRNRLDINEAMREVIEFTSGETAENSVSVQLDLATGLPAVAGDRVQLQQVILNLIMNAIEAMSGVSDGARNLHISTRSAEPSGVRVTVRDSGCGLSSESIGRVFEAFYTTKHSGLGMGLSISRSIIEAHGGQMWAAANLPRGAIFEFTLPACPDLGMDVPAGFDLPGKTAPAPAEIVAEAASRNRRRYTAIAVGRPNAAGQKTDSPADWLWTDGSSPKRRFGVAARDEADWRPGFH